MCLRLESRANSSGVNWRCLEVTMFCNKYAKTIGVLSLGLALLSACGPKAPAATPAAVVEVGVIKVATASASITSELPGRTTAFRKAEVRPQVSGIIQKRLFTEGAEVKVRVGKICK